MTTAEILRASLELLEDPDHWTQGVFARDRAGNSVKPWDPDACRWCMEGAPEKVGFGHPHAVDVTTRLLNDALGRGTNTNAAHYNDATGRRHSEVLAVIRRAIDLAEAEEQHA